MQAYMLSIVGVVVASVFIDLVMPVGQTSKYIKSIFAIFVIFVLVSPVLNLISDKEKIKDLVQSDGYNLVDTYLENFYKSKVEAYENEILSVFESYDIHDVDISIEYSVEHNDLIVKSVNVNLKNVVIGDKADNVNLYSLSNEIINEVIYEEVLEVRYLWKTFY